jgi:hypothetical protein
MAIATVLGGRSMERMSRRREAGPALLRAAESPGTGGFSPNRSRSFYMIDRRDAKQLGGWSGRLQSR